MPGGQGRAKENKTKGSEAVVRVGARRYAGGRSEAGTAAKEKKGTTGARDP